MLEGYGSTGRYATRGDLMVIDWDKFAEDLFYDVGGLWVHKTIWDNVPRLQEICLVSVGESRFPASQITLRLPGSGYEVSLRTNTTDGPTFEQVFDREEYASPNLPPDANFIIDLGANIGLSALFFCLHYPKAAILALEPSEGNYRQLLRNLAAAGPRVSAMHAAAWHVTGKINLQTDAEDGNDLGEWGGQVSSSRRGVEVACLCMADIIRMSGHDHVDILKIDIEGAELELFSLGDRLWLDAVDLIVVETHDRFRPGSDAAVRVALAALFVELPPRGENLFFKHRRCATAEDRSF